MIYHYVVLTFFSCCRSVYDLLNFMTSTSKLLSEFYLHALVSSVFSPSLRDLCVFLKWDKVHDEQVATMRLKVFCRHKNNVYISSRTCPEGENLLWWQCHAEQGRRWDKNMSFFYATGIENYIVTTRHWIKQVQS